MSVPAVTSPYGGTVTRCSRRAAGSWPAQESRRPIVTRSSTTSDLGLSPPCGRRGRDRVRDLPAADHLAEDRVLAGQPLGAADGDEELRPVGTRAGIRHSQQVRAGERQVRVDLVFELVARAAGAGTEWVPALDHETRNHPVEDRPVVQPALPPAAGLGVGPLPGALGKLDEVRHRLGCLVRKELHLDVPERSSQRCDELGGQPGLLWVGGAAPRAALSVPSSRHPRMIALPLPGQRGSESSYNASQCTRRYPCSAPAPSPTQIWIGASSSSVSRRTPRSPPSMPPPTQPSSPARAGKLPATRSRC